ncbi:DNA-binding IclR family transcriptional regulator [Amycolatopsis endophytica]|uniref:DNA-binding IclR family transcriptional regulator n=1 Tax=Amycolatopsis endophytica TaxID=860233 RepID=A0A853BBT5_9PSEU|nr:IclR family transcriptional regulator [Amycolatopsis endophytica]NYI92245.1 DNA-binding IclR family transcriptional regulator [Amycolatopsis endophytica]
MCSSERDTPASMIARVSRVFESFRPPDDALGVREIARRTGLASSTVSRIVRELVEHRFLEPAGRGFRIGLRFFELGEQAARPHQLRQMAMANMSDLRSATRQTVHLAVLDGTEVVYVIKLRSRTAPPLGSRVGGRMPAHATGVGKALLAFAGPGVVDRVIEAGLPRLGPGTITDGTRLRDELAAIREAGIAYETEESGPDVVCVAAPVTAREGRPIAGLSISTRRGEVDTATLGPAVRTAALALGRQAARMPALSGAAWTELG